MPKLQPKEVKFAGLDDYPPNTQKKHLATPGASAIMIASDTMRKLNGKSAVVCFSGQRWVPRRGWTPSRILGVLDKIDAIAAKRYRDAVEHRPLPEMRLPPEEHDPKKHSLYRSQQLGRSTVEPEHHSQGERDSKSS